MEGKREFEAVNNFSSFLHLIFFFFSSSSSSPSFFLLPLLLLGFSTKHWLLFPYYQNHHFWFFKQLFFFFAGRVKRMTNAKGKELKIAKRAEQTKKKKIFHFFFRIFKPLFLSKTFCTYIPHFFFATAGYFLSLFFF